MAKLSQRFYETLGEDVVNQLEEWLNAVEAYRTELRGPNDLSYMRFEMKLEQQIAGLRTELRQQMAELKAEMRAR